ncbi:hypothetical protein PAPYR_13076 [Paratrimastix pyriformis]|uniref:Uncharacterized protein n=1 Tax=Paratrimastix pyriformis TaxID=342808 RepID=A0ABQ8U542_9EUKA|nr:hypothetical protein PAPYR_13076 [Paratrimastix pyriformis]
MARHEHQNENSRAKILAHIGVVAAPLTGALGSLGGTPSQEAKSGDWRGCEAPASGSAAVVKSQSDTLPDTTLPTWWIHGVPLNVSEDAIKTRMDELGIPIESVEGLEPTSSLPTSSQGHDHPGVWDRLRALGKFIDGPV